ncbi:MAG: hypothetical protein DRI69_12205, partial [Bacteroidetes bacterium]
MSSTGCQDYGCFMQTDVNDMASLPLVTVHVDIHFIESNGNNFQCTDPQGQYYAPTYAQQFLGFSNQLFSDPPANFHGTSPDLLDTRIRFAFYNNPSDLCDAVFIHQTAPTTFTNPDALHILIYDKPGVSGFSGKQISQSVIELYNIHQEVFDNGGNDVHGAGGVLNHEFGHLCGLCHAYSAQNDCPDMDPSAECGGSSSSTCNGANCPTGSTTLGVHPSCGSSSCFGCYCTLSSSNNFMSLGTQEAIVRSQWAQMYGFIVKTKLNSVRFDDSCEDPPSLPALEIPANTIVEWNGVKYLDRHVEIRSGAILKIHCDVYMAKGRRIIVNRGARLFVLGGSITSMTNECLWDGIILHGNASLYQPDPVDAKDENTVIPANGSGVVWLNGAVLSRAGTAISTKATGGLSTHDYFGGLVIVENSDFIGNKRAVEFLKYSLPNKSYFVNCEIKPEPSSPVDVFAGISIWACEGIGLSQTHFTDVSFYGMRGIDFTVNVEDCSFEGADFGFRSESTMPNYNLSSSTIDDCKFGDNAVDMYHGASPNMIYPQNIVNNLFVSDGSFAIRFGIRMFGESLFSIRKNIFQEKYFSIQLSATGSLGNSVSCNTLDNISFGVQANFNNERLVILGNTFLSSGIRQIYVNGNQSELGVINSLQGEIETAAGNCFTSTNSYVIQANQNSTELFNYYVKDLGGFPEPCERPNGSLTDSGPNNYVLKNSENEYDCNDEGILSGMTETDLDSARFKAFAKKTIHEADPRDFNKKYDYLLARDYQEKVLRAVVQETYENNDLDKVEELLLEENSKVYDRAVIGLRTRRLNIAGAQSLLDNMTIESQDDIWFKDIMAINFSVIDERSSIYSPTTQEDSILHVIASTEHSIMQGYACALLYLTTGFSCDADTLQMRSRNVLKEKQDQSIEYESTSITI